MPFKATGGGEMKNSVSLEKGKISLLRPVPNDIKISSPFGKRKIKGVEEFHKGVDFSAPIGTPIKASSDGAAFRVGWENDDNHDQGFGYRIWQEIEIDGMRLYLWYGHLSKIFIKQGDRIKQGQEIGLTGNTGRSTGPHLHIGCRPLDSGQFLDIEFYEG